MMAFSYSFCMTMLHSLWQAAMLVLLYLAVDNIMHKNNAPLAKRNVLYAALFTQVVISIFTFSFYFFDSSTSSGIGIMTSAVTSLISVETLQAAAPWIFGIYIFAISYKLLQALINWYRFKLNFKTSLQKPVVELKLFTELKAHQFGIKRKVKLWLSHSVQTPVTFGYFKPVILLPVALLNNISVTQAETLILHELAHIRTNDYLLNWFLILAETLFFFNPAIIGICKRIRLERELNCDIQVISFNYSPALYAETLLQAEKMKKAIPAFQLAAVNNKRNLLHRIRFFTNEKVLTEPFRFNIVAPIVGLILISMLSIALITESGSSHFSVNATAGIPYLPVNNSLVTNADLGKTIVNEFSAKENISENINEDPLVNISNKTKPTPVVKTKPVDLVYETESSFLPENLIIPVAEKENDAAKQIIIKEESSEGAIVRVFYLSFEDGKWILKPEWIISAKELNTDSLSVKKDSLIKHSYPAQQ